MNFIKAIIATIVNVADAVINFTVGPFINMSSKDEGTRQRACFGVLLRILVACGYVFGWTGLVYAIAATLLTVSMYLVMIGLVIETLSIFSLALAGADVSKFKTSADCI